jgi:hypothetical protein
LCSPSPSRPHSAAPFWRARRPRPRARRPSSSRHSRPRPTPCRRRLRRRSRAPRRLSSFLRNAPDPRIRGVSLCSERPSCNAGAIRCRPLRRSMKCPGEDAAIRLRRCREEHLHRRGDRGSGQSGMRPDRPSGQCGAGRDDDVDSAAFVCPGGTRPDANGADVPLPDRRLTDGCNEDRPCRCRAAAIATR